MRRPTPARRTIRRPHQLQRFPHVDLGTPEVDDEEHEPELEPEEEPEPQPHWLREMVRYTSMIVVILAALVTVFAMTKIGK